MDLELPRDCVQVHADLSVEMLTFVNFRNCFKVVNSSRSTFPLAAVPAVTSRASNVVEIKPALAHFLFR